MTQRPYTPDEMLAVSIAREIPDGVVVAQGIATPLVAAGYFLARMLHAPNMLLSFTIGNSFGVETGRLSLTQFEHLTLGRALQCWSFADCVAEYLPTLRPWIEYFRPAQIDPYGNFNNIVIGDYQQPQLRLPGCGGIADVTTYLDAFYIYVPRHDPRAFVEQVDFVSGVGFRPGESADERKARGITGGGPQRVITDLGVFGFDADGRMACLSLHPGVEAADVRDRTGFALDVNPNTRETIPPTAEELTLLRQEIDPLGIRQLELLGRRDRQRKIREILAKEAELAGRNAKS